MKLLRQNALWVRGPRKIVEGWCGRNLRRKRAHIYFNACSNPVAYLKKINILRVIHMSMFVNTLGWFVN